MRFDSIAARKDRGYVTGILDAERKSLPPWWPTHPDPAYLTGYLAGWNGEHNPARGAKLKTPDQVRAYFHLTT